MSRGEYSRSKIFIGDIPKDTTEKDVERAFSYYGDIRSVWVARNPPGFAFCEYEDTRDAEDAIKGMDGNKLNGGTIRVEKATGGRGGRRGGGGDRGGDRGRRGTGRPFDPRDRCYRCGESGHYAYDCTGSRRNYSRSRSRGRSASRSRSRSKGDRRRSRSHSRGDRRGGSRDRSRSRSRDARSHSRS